MGDRGTRDGLRAGKSGLGLVRTSLDGWSGLCKNGGSGGLPLSVRVGKKSEEFLFIKQGQCHDVRAQCRDILEGLFASVTTLRPTSRRVKVSIKPTSRRSREWCQLTSRCWGQHSDVTGSL